jgi:hypothetical protein
MQQELANNIMNFELRIIFVHTSKGSLTCSKILRHGANALLFLPNVYRPLKSIALGRVSTREPWVQWQARQPLHDRGREVILSVSQSLSMSYFGIPIN